MIYDRLAPVSEKIAFLWYMEHYVPIGVMYRGQDVYLVYNDVLESAKAQEKLINRMRTFIEAQGLSMPEEP